MERGNVTAARQGGSRRRDNHPARALDPGGSLYYEQHGDGPNTIVFAHGAGDEA